MDGRNSSGNNTTTNNSNNNNNNNSNNTNNNCRKFKRGNSNPKTKKQLENELNRQRSFFVGSPQNQSAHDAQGDYSNRNSNSAIGQKKHPTIAIYRPPTTGLQKSKTIKDVATDTSEVNGKLNVHAKEFTLERSRTAPQSMATAGASKSESGQNSSGPMLSRSRTFYTNGDFKPNNQRKSYEYKGYKNNFQPTKNTYYPKDTQGPKVQFKDPKRKPKPILNDEPNKCATESNNDFGLRRSKSYNGPDSKYYYQNTLEEPHTPFNKYQPKEFCVKDLSGFPEDINDMAKRIVKDTKSSPAKDLMLLALKIIEHAVDRQDALKPSVNLSLYIIERDTRDTYVNMIINTIQLWFVKREKLLQPPRFFTFATFVLQMYKGMKQNKVLLSRMEKEVYSRKQTLLMLLFKICEHCLTPTKEEDSTEEIECLSEIVSAVGKDLEQEVPDTSIQLFASIRDATLTRDRPPSAKKTLLRLVELRASEWTLPSSAANYYDSKT